MTLLLNNVHNYACLKLHNIIILFRSQQRKYPKLRLLGRFAYLLSTDVLPSFPPVLIYSSAMPVFSFLLALNIDSLSRVPDLQVRKLSKVSDFTHVYLQYLSRLTWSLPQPVNAGLKELQSEQNRSE